ncbi:MAG: hypothetical protein ABL998_18080 [Planctomycetota bacterium]
MSASLSETLLEQLLHGEPGPSSRVLAVEEPRAWERTVAATHEALLARHRLTPPPALLQRLLVAARGIDLRPPRLP